MDAGTLVMQTLPVDLIVILPRPQADVAELPQADAAAHEVLVGVQNQVQQVLVGRHGEKTVDFDRGEVGEEMVQLIVSVLGGIEQVPVQLDIKRAVLFRIGHLIRCGQLSYRRVGGQAICEKLLVAGHKPRVRDVEVIVRADAVILQWIQAAAKLPLDHNRMQACGAQLLIKFGELRRAYRLVQHLPYDLLLGHSEQCSVILGGCLADGLKENRQQLLLIGQREDGRPVRFFSRQTSAGDGNLGNMEKLCFSGRQGHIRVPNPFSEFFDGVGDEQRGGADERAQCVADHVIRLRKTQRVAVLGVLDSRAERAADERCEDNPQPTVPPSRKRIGQRQPQREKEEDVHQHLAVDLRLYPRSGQRGEGGKDGLGNPRCAGQEGGVEDHSNNNIQNDAISISPFF